MDLPYPLGGGAVRELAPRLRARHDRGVPPRLPASLPAVLLLLCACRSEGSVTLLEPLAPGGGGASDGDGAADDTAADDTAAAELPGDTGEDTGGEDTGGEDTGEAGLPEPDWCLDFEDYSLDDAGYSGTSVVLHDGAIVKLVGEGTEFSALAGEELLELPGYLSLLLRSSDAGEVSSLAIATTPSFTAGAGDLGWWTLSEADSRAVVLYADLLDGNGTILASLDLEAQTGGYVPALLEEHEPIEEYPDITHGEPTPGALVQQLTDLSPFAGQELRLRLYQHTAIEGQGFFTLFDDICAGAALAEVGVERLEWGPPDPSH